MTSIHRASGMAAATLAAVIVACLSVSGLAAQEPLDAPPPPDRETALPERPDTVPQIEAPEADGEEAPEEAGQEGQAAGDTVRDTSADAVIEALRRLEGFQPVEYTAERAEFRAAERELRLYGSAEVERGTDRIEAQDTLVYRERQRVIAAYGSPRVRGQEGSEIEGDVMFYNLDRQRAIVRGGRTQVAEAGAQWFVRGEDIAAEGRDRIYARESTYTSDDRPEPQYHFQSDRVLVIQDRILVGRPARLYFRNVPVAWLPFIVQDMSRGRRSGLLTPQFGVNDIVRTSSGGSDGRGGTGRQISNVGFYWAISDYLDARLAGQWRSGVSSGVAGALRYNWRRQFLRGDLTVNHDWQEGDRPSVLRINSSNSWQPTERSNLRASINYVSQASYVRETNPDPNAATQDMRSNLSLDHRFDWGRFGVAATRRQSLVDDAIEMTLPRITVSPHPITLFRARGPVRWYNNATFSISGDGSRTLTDPGRNVSAAQRPRTRSEGSVSQSFNLGNLTWRSGGRFSRLETGELPPSEIDAFFRGSDGWDMVGHPGLARPLDGTDRDEADWNTSLSYQISLIGSTSISPNVSLSQSIASDTVAGGEYVLTPTRLGVGAGLSTDLFGFFPGVGGFSAFRHRVSPRLQYTYQPAVEFDDRQTRIFGSRDADERNLVSLSLSQTFEGRPRERERSDADPEPSPEAEAGAMSGTVPDLPGADENEDADLAGAERPSPEAPEGEDAAADGARRAQPVTLLAIQTSALEYDLARARLGDPGFVTRDVTTTISSDYLRGLRLSFRHELFDRSEVEPGDPHAVGEFRPQLSSFNTSFRLGPGSPPIRFLLGLFDQGTGSRRDESATDVPSGEDADDPLADAGAAPDGMGGMPTATANPRAAGGGPWALDLRYSFSRRPRQPRRPDEREARADQNIDGTLSFSPTPNWAVNWQTGYSFTTGEFQNHQIGLRRDLYRWEANFSFTRTVFGAALFSVSVRLKDLPDLKFEHHERDLGRGGGRGTGL